MFGWYKMALLFIHLPLLVFFFSIQTKTSIEEPTTFFFFFFFCVRLLMCFYLAFWTAIFCFIFSSFSVQYLTENLIVEYLACVFCCGLIHLSFPWKSNLSVQTILILCSVGFNHNLPHIFWKSRFFMHDSTPAPLVVQLTPPLFYLLVDFLVFGL